MFGRHSRERGTLALSVKGSKQVLKPLFYSMEICPKCGKPAWAPYVMQVTKKYGQRYKYRVYRHPDGRRRTPRKCTVRLTDEKDPGRAEVA